jgi:dephospho-CoA kinase
VKIIGLSGGIGTGKSTVAGFLKELGAGIIDADRIGHYLLASDTVVKEQLVTVFGRRILDAEKQIDHSKLAAIVFSNTESLAKLNRIMHPPIRRQVEREVEDYRRRGTEVVVIEAPLLDKAGWMEMVDRLWVTTAPEDVILNRLTKSSRLTKQEALDRISNQPSPDEYAERADVVISTDLSLDELKNNITALWPV